MVDKYDSPIIQTKLIQKSRSYVHLLKKTELYTLQDWLKDLKEFQLDSLFDTNVLGRAYLYTASLKIDDISENNINGRTGDLLKYETSLSMNEQSVYGSCTCPYEGKCKHIAALLLVARKRSN